MLEGASRGLDHFINDCLYAVAAVLSNVAASVDTVAFRIGRYLSRLVPALSRFIYVLSKAALVLLPAVVSILGVLIAPTDASAVVWVTLGVVYALLAAIGLLTHRRYRRRRSYYGYR
jgi:hypothetical protein